MSDLRDTLDHILRLCNSSRTYSRRTQEIHEVTMKGLGMTAGQREARHVAILTRIGGDPLAQAYRERAAKRRENDEKRAAQSGELEAQP